MGLLIAIARKVQVKSAIFNGQHRQIIIQRAKTDLASKISDYEMARSDYDQNSAEQKAFNERIERLNQIDKRLDEQLNKIQTQLQLLEAEIGSLDKMIQDSIQQFYAR